MEYPAVAMTNVPLDRFELPPRQQLSDEVAAYVRALITSGQLRPGEYVRQDRIAEHLGISATPVREGLLTLRGEGFVGLMPRRGFVVAALTGRDIQDMFAAQALLAGELAARFCARVSPADVVELENLQSELEEAARIGDFDRMESLNHDFHRRINDGARAPKLAWLLTVAVRYVPHRFYATIEGWARASVSDHWPILEALRAGEEDAARVAMAMHMQHSGDLLAAHVAKRNPDTARDVTGQVVRTHLGGELVAESSKPADGRTSAWSSSREAAARRGRR